MLETANHHVDVVNVLPKHRAYMASINERQTPAYIASFYGHINVLRLFIKLGADVTASGNPVRASSLQHVFFFFFSHIRPTYILLKRGVDCRSVL